MLIVTAKQTLQTPSIFEHEYFNKIYKALDYALVVFYEIYKKPI